MIAYTPEIYVVNYGTDMNTLNIMSEAVSSGSDFEDTNLAFSVLTTGISPTTVYYYQLVATNSIHTTFSGIMSFTTPEKRKLYARICLPTSGDKTFKISKIPETKAPLFMSNIIACMANAARAS